MEFLYGKAREVGERVLTGTHLLRIGDLPVDYHDFIRRRLAAPGYAFNPVTELRHGLETICGAIRDRKWAVDRARAARVHLRPHPPRLPPNIYGTYGDWETYSTPSRDARLKVAFIELKREIQQLINEYEAGAENVAYDGEDLAGDLYRTFLEENDQCTFTYWRADGSRVRLKMSHAMDRLWALSFDPYHCPARRWGAAGAELAACTDDEEKTQRYLRYQAQRTYDVRMDFALHELKPPYVAPPEEGGLGVEAPADADLKRYLIALSAPSAPAEEAARALAAAASGDGELLTAAEAAAIEEPRFPEWHYKIMNPWRR